MYCIPEINTSIISQILKCLQGAYLKIEKGESIGILGATGSGKSTLVSLITRFYDVTSGEVLVDNVNVKDYDLKHLEIK